MRRKFFTAAAAAILFASTSSFYVVMIGLHFCSRRVVLIKEAATTKNTTTPRGKKGSICGDCFMWETDFFLEILSDRADRCVEFCESDSLMLAVSYINGVKHNTVRREIAKQMNHNETVILPSILYSLSDEDCQSSQDEWRLYEYFDLVFKQYSCMDQHLERQRQLLKTTKFMVAPVLGYQKGYFGKRGLALDALQMQERLANEPRELAWAFVGTMKTNRWEMVEAFQDVKPNVQTTAKLTEMRAIYERANFVLSGRGTISLDCFRHYEASIAGAIPVIVGSSYEINSTFLSLDNNELPPWIFSDSWSSAKVLVLNLLSDEAALMRLRLENIKWMQLQLVRMRNTVDEFFSEQYAIK